MNKLISNVAKLLITIAFLLSSCSTPPPRLYPAYPGVDPKAQKLVDEFLFLSHENHLTFNRPVTVGFTNIDYGAVIGMCHYGPFFREIDLDQKFWDSSTETTKLALIFHELTHCYCYRDHDFAKGQMYEENADLRMEKELIWEMKGGHRDGYYEDGCPTSLMYPEITEDSCTLAHYSAYVQELFNRCQPW